MGITLIAAMAKNRVIGKDNRMLWRLPDELKHFVRLTTGKTVLMGRLTYESLPGGALRNRKNVVLTRRPDYQAEGCETVGSIEEALTRYARTGEELMIAGGADIYKQLLPCADTMLLTVVEAELEGDAYFPEWPEGEWTLAASEYHPADERHAYPFDIRTYRRIAGGALPVSD